MNPIPVFFIFPPTHTAFIYALSLLDALPIFTVTAEVTEVALVQPVPGKVTAKLYTPLAPEGVGVNTGDAAVEVELFGLVQVYDAVHVVLTAVVVKVIFVHTLDWFGESL